MPETTIDGATAPQRSTVLFDFDGVLVRGDSFGRFLRARIRASRWRTALAFMATPIAIPMLLSGRGIRYAARMYVWIARGRASPAVFRASIEQFGTQLGGNPHVLIADGLAALRAHRLAGDRVVVVSGCEENLVRTILHAAGIDDVEIVASRLGREGRHCYRERKLAALSAAGIAPPWQIAYTDSIADLPMLRHAERPILVNADEKLLARVAAALGRNPENKIWK